MGPGGNGAGRLSRPYAREKITMSLNVCFISPKGYGAIAPGAGDAHIGGAEVQTGIVAAALGRRGHRVSFVTADHGQADGQRVGGVTVYKTCRPRQGLPILRFVHPRWSSLRRALARADSAVYVQASGDALTGQALHWCRRHGRKFVCASASDADCTEGLINLRTRRERVLYRYGLKRADAVIAQTATQQEMLLRHFRRRSVVIRYCCPDGQYHPRPWPEPAGRRRLLWVGRFSPEKRLELLLELARMLRRFDFDVVGDANVETPYSLGLKAQAKGLSNVQLHGRLPRAGVQAFYGRAAALVCTSAWEGFPNVFVEAWRHGLPTVATVDPDGVIESNRLGGAAQDAEGLKCRIEQLLAWPQRWLDCSRRARDYYLANHTCEAAADAYECLLIDVLNRPSATPRGRRRRREDQSG